MKRIVIGLLFCLTVLVETPGFSFADIPENRVFLGAKGEKEPRLRFSEKDKHSTRPEESKVILLPSRIGLIPRLVPNNNLLTPTLERWTPTPKKSFWRSLFKLFSVPLSPKPLWR